MPQNVNLSVAGLYTSLSDFNGLPPGALNRALNVEIRYKNVLEPRRGFESLENSYVPGVTFNRMINFIVDGEDRTVALNSAGVLQYYSGANPWPNVPGNFSEGITNPDDINAKSRLVRAGQNLYVTSQDGVRSISTGEDAVSLRAGVPKGLNIEAETDDADLEGFLDNNSFLDTTGNLTAGAATILQLADRAGIAVGKYVTGITVDASRVVQDLTYTSELFGDDGNLITIAYLAGGVAGAEAVNVVGNAISVLIASGVSTANQIRTAINASAAALALVSVAVSGVGGNAQVAVAAAPLEGGIDNTIPEGTKVLTITEPEVILIQTGNTVAGANTITNLPSNAGIVAGIGVSGDGIPDGAIVTAVAGAGPYTVTLDVNCFQTSTGASFQFSSLFEITMDQNAVSTLTATPISFYSGSQVGYRIVFGRIETDEDGNTITRLGSPSTIGIATNTSAYSKNIVVTATIPKNSEDMIDFYQLYRSEQTDSIDISPLDQYNLVAEQDITAQQFIDRVLELVDETPDSLKGIPLYAGSDREGISQANDPPPMAWDLCPFRNFMIYGNITKPTTLQFAITSVGAPAGLQDGDTITIAGTFAGVAFVRVYTASLVEDAAAREFEVFETGTVGQDIADTANSLIRVINYDNDLPIHAILLSGPTDLSGQILLEADYPSYDTFTVTASDHVDAYDPSLDGTESQVNTINNGILVSKIGELEAVPALNFLPVGDSSSPVLRCIPLRDYVVILKTDGIYKLQGFTPNGLVVNPFDLTTKIIGADTAVSFNSSVWMLSNQGVVSISDGGVDAKSIPVDDQLNQLIGNNLDALTDAAFGVGYESDRKYILSVPSLALAYTDLQYVFNYVTNTYTNYDRNLKTAYINTTDGKLYISRLDVLNTGVSKERKRGDYSDYVDEGVANEILTIVSDKVLELADTAEVLVGDILYQSDVLFSVITEIDITTNYVTVESELDWQLGAAQVLAAFSCEVQWKQVFGDNPAFVRQFSEGLVLFKNTRFNAATLNFATDYSGSSDPVTVYGTGTGLWGLFNWGEILWGAPVLPDNIRFYIPQNKQLGSYLIPSMIIRQGYSDFKLQGLSITYFNVSPEVGL